MLRSRASASLSIKKDSTLDNSVLNLLKNSSWMGGKGSRTSASVGGCVVVDDVKEWDETTRK
jgi:hypothetical protein